jgi:hypothetical protein
MSSAQTPHVWKFFRTGGIDQVSLETASDLLNLGQLDQKLWVALSCPVKGLELDEKTLALIDTDGDGRIRVPELLAAIQVGRRAAEGSRPDCSRGEDGLPLAAINDSTPEGRVLLASAKQILANLGKSAAAISWPMRPTRRRFLPARVQRRRRHHGGRRRRPAVAQFIKDIIATKGRRKDRSGTPGVTRRRSTRSLPNCARLPRGRPAGPSHRHPRRRHRRRLQRR